MTRLPQSAAVAIAMLASGAAALIYEVVWIKLLALAFGSTALSLAVVTSIFFLGLAGGALLAARLVDRLRQPLRLFALLELAVAATAPLTLLLLEQAPHLYGWLGASPSTWSLLGLKALIALAILALPALAIGATLPLAVAGLETGSRVGLRTASLYSVNTAGAVAGTLLVGLLLVPRLGLLGALLIGSGLDLLAAVLALAASGRHHTADRRCESSGPAPVGTPPAPAATMLLAAIGGLAGMAYEVAFTRALHVIMASTVETIAVVLAAFLTGIALGSAGYRWWGRRQRADLARLGWLFVASAVAALGAVCFLEPLAYACRQLADQGGSGPALQRFAWAGALLIAPAALNGAIFPAVVDATGGDRGGRTVGQLLSANTAGSVVGSLLAGTLLIPAFGTTVALYAVTVVVLVSALLCGYLCHQRRLAVAVLLSLLAASTLWPGLDLARLAQVRMAAADSYAQTRASLDRVMKSAVYTAEGSTGAVTLIEAPRATWTLYLDGLIQASRSLGHPRYAIESVLLGIIPAALAAGDQRALVIGLGGGVTLDALRASGFAQIDVVELEPRVVEALRALPDDSARLLEQPGVRLLIADGREFLQQRAVRNDGPAYDVIASQPSHWWMAGVGNLATLEFYRLVRGALNDGGVYIQWINGQRMTETAIRAVIGAMQQVFDETLVFAVDRSGLYYLAGVRGTLRAPPEQVARRLQRPEVRALAADGPRTVDDLAAWIALSGRAPAQAPLPSNRDRDALVESQLAAASLADQLDLAALTPPLLDRLGPPPALRPVDAAAALAQQIETIERRLNTPASSPQLLEGGLDGALPFGPLQPGLVRLALAAARPALDRCWQRYFEGRMQLVDGELPAARRALADVCPEQPDHPAVRRGLRFVALLDRDSGQCQAGLDALRPAEVSAALDHFLVGLLRQCLGQDPAADYRAALVDWHEPALPGAALRWAVANREPIPDDLLQRMRGPGVNDLDALQAALALDVEASDRAAVADRARALVRVMEQGAALLRQRARRLEQAGDFGRAEVQYRRWHELMPRDPVATLARVGFLERRGRPDEAEQLRQRFVAEATDRETARRMLRVAGAEVAGAGSDGLQPGLH